MNHEIEGGADQPPSISFISAFSFNARTPSDVGQFMLVSPQLMILLMRRLG
jgi:hypothetical protein